MKTRRNSNHETRKPHRITTASAMTNSRMTNGESIPKHKGRLKWLVLGLGAVLLVYAGTFASWWLSSPSRVVTEKAKAVRYVDFHMTPFRWRTQVLWVPAFIFVEYVCGYRVVSAIAAEHESIYTYASD